MNLWRNASRLGLRLLGGDLRVVSITLATGLAHLAFAGRYGIFGDELYFIVCGRHPDFGYVDEPPLLPLIDAATIERTIDAVVKYGAAIVGLPAVDTIKQVERTADGAIVTATIPRERIVQAQTPQGARFGLLRRAFIEAEADEFSGTDEASLLERSGIEVAVVSGSARNFKITQPGDIELAEFYLGKA